MNSSVFLLKKVARGLQLETTLLFSEKSLRSDAALLTKENQKCCFTASLSFYHNIANTGKKKGLAIFANICSVTRILMLGCSKYCIYSSWAGRIIPCKGQQNTLFQTLQNLQDIITLCITPTPPPAQMSNAWNSGTLFRKEKARQIMIILTKRKMKRLLITWCGNSTHNMQFLCENMRM